MREEYLDGLRGWAALVVVSYHTTLMLWGELALPFKLIFLDGPFAVYIFFVLSGYVLSVGTFRTGSRRDVVDLALRRYPRLTIPILLISSIALALMLLDLYSNPEASKILGTEWWLGIFYTFDPGFFDMLYYALWVVYFGGDAYWYNSSLWTMPTEMQGSLLIFAFLLLAGKSSALRLVGHILFIGVCLWLKSFMFAMALGVAIANLLQLPAYRKYSESKYAGWASWGFLAAGLYLAGSRTDTYASISSGFGAAVVVFAVMTNKHFKRFLSLPISQMLGRISFPIYLVHIVVICSIASWVVVMVAGLGLIGPVTKVLLAVLTVGLSIAAAFIFAPVERLSVSLARRFSRAVLGRAEKSMAAQRDTTVLGSLGK